MFLTPSQIDDLPDNGPLTVSQLTAQIARLFNDHFPQVCVLGEVSNLKQQSSGHVYFTLKDSGAQLPCVMFARSYTALGLRIEDGMQLIVFGRISVYEPHGRYQMVVNMAVDEGKGRLRRQFDQLKQKLTAEGLFDSERKKPLPVFPVNIGFITSPTGAAVRDFISILRRRQWKGTLTVFPVRVQGHSAPEEIAQMIRWVDRHCNLDILVVGRGGGSIEDLWSFNEEIVVRALAGCSIPTISAVGHETDITLSDFAADLRVETPSAAAEKISSQCLEQIEIFEQLKLDFLRTVRHRIERLRHQSDQLGARLAIQNPEALVVNRQLKIADLTNRLNAVALRQFTDLKKRLDRTRSTLDPARVQSALSGMRVQTDQLQIRLGNLNPEKTLRRGFTYQLDRDGNFVSTRKKALSHTHLRTVFQDGTVDVIIPSIIPSSQ
jgi:exodeoxyribonuclease VII large subunit